MDGQWEKFPFGVGVVFCAILFLTSTPAADTLTWKDFNVGKAQAVLREFSVSGLSYADSVYDWQNKIVEARRLKRDEVVIERLRARQKQWRQLAQSMERQLAEEVERAKHDAGIRQVALALEAISFVASAYHDIREATASDVGSQDRDVDVDGSAAEGDVRVRQEHSIESFKDGQWRLLNLKRIWTEGKLPPEILDAQVTSMRSQIGTWVEGVPTLLCNSEYGGCFEAPPVFDFVTPTLIEPTIISAPSVRTESGLNILAVAAELALDLTPIPDGYRVITGSDPFTGEDANRTEAALMFGTTVVTGGVAKVAVAITKNFTKAKKVRDLVSVLERAGFSRRAGKGSHRNYKHPEVSRLVTISGKEADDIKPYQRKAVESALKELGILDTVKK